MDVTIGIVIKFVLFFMNRFFNNKFNKSACTYVMSIFWNRLLTYSKLQKYLLLITASLSLGMICVGRQPVLVNGMDDFRESRKTAQLREYVEGIERTLRAIKKAQTDNRVGSIVFLENIGFVFGARLTEINGRTISPNSIMYEFDAFTARFHLELSNLFWWRQLCFFYLGWSYVYSSLLEEYENEKALQNTCASLNGSGNSSFSIAKSKKYTGKSGMLNKNDVSDKTACAMVWINKRLDDIAVIDEHDVSYKKICDTHLAPSLEHSDSVYNCGNWLSDTLGRELGLGEPLWLPKEMKWSEFDLDVLKKLLRDEIDRESARTEAARDALIWKREALMDSQEEQRKNAGKNKSRTSFIKKNKENDIIEGEINVKLNLNKREKLALRAIRLMYDYINNM